MAVHSRLRRWSLLAVAVGLLDAARSLALEGPTIDSQEATLAADDECAAGAEDCAVSALQLKARAHVSEQEEQSANLTGLLSMEEEVAAGNSCPTATYNGPSQGAEACFCHKIANSGCASQPCACREGCGGYQIRNIQSTSFHNYAWSSCPVKMLTLPNGYYRDFEDLKDKCGGGTAGLLSAMLVDGYNAYHLAGGVGSVMQCIHKPFSVSVHWLHLHSFCTTGQVDGLPNRGSAYCHVMNNIPEASAIAAKFLSWSR